MFPSSKGAPVVHEDIRRSTLAWPHEPCRQFFVRSQRRPVHSQDCEGTRTPVSWLLASCDIHQCASRQSSVDQLIPACAPNAATCSANPATPRANSCQAQPRSSRPHLGSSTCHAFSAGQGTKHEKHLLIGRVKSAPPGGSKLRLHLRLCCELPGFRRSPVPHAPSVPERGPAQASDRVQW